MLTDLKYELISQQLDPELLDKALDEFVFAEIKEEVLKPLK